MSAAVVQEALPAPGLNKVPSESGSRDRSRSRERGRDRGGRNRDYRRDSRSKERGGGHRSRDEKGFKVQISNIPSEKVNERQVEDWFSKHGRISSLNLSKSGCFIYFEKEESAELCMSAENGSMFHGNKIEVKLLTRDKERDGGKSSYRDRRRDSPGSYRRDFDRDRNRDRDRDINSRGANDDREFPSRFPPGDRDFPPRGPPGDRDFPPRGPPGDRDFPPRGPPGDRDFPPRGPPGDRDFPPRGPPGDRDFPPRGPPGDRDFPPRGPLGDRDFPPRGPPGDRDFPPRGPPGDRDFPPRGPPGDRDFPPRGPPGDRDFPPRGPPGDRDFSSRSLLDDRDMPSRGHSERDHSRGGFDRAPNRGPPGSTPSSQRDGPDYQNRFPPPVHPSERAYDAAVIAATTDVIPYAESLERRLNRVMLTTNLIVLKQENMIHTCMDDILRKGVLYAILVTRQHEQHLSCTMRIICGAQPTEHRNMPVDDALALVGRHFEAFMHELKECAPPPAPDPSRLPPGFVQPTAQVTHLLHLLADARMLTILELEELEDFMRVRKDRLIAIERRTAPPSSRLGYSDVQHSGSSMMQGLPKQQAEYSRPPPGAPTGVAAPPKDEKTILLQQAELQAKILSILNPAAAPKPAAPEPGKLPRPPQSAGGPNVGQIQKALDTLLGTAAAPAQSQAPPADQFGQFGGASSFNQEPAWGGQGFQSYSEQPDPRMMQQPDPRMGQSGGYPGYGDAAPSYYNQMGGQQSGSASMPGYRGRGAGPPRGGRGGPPRFGAPSRPPPFNNN